MTFSDLFKVKVVIIQRQITWKWYNILLQLYLVTYNGRPIESRIGYDLSNGAIFNDLERPLRHSLTLNISETVRHTDIASLKYNRDWYTTYATVLFRIILSDIEWLSKIFSDMKRRAVSLRQLSFLFCLSRVVDELATRQLFTAHQIAAGGVSIPAYWDPASLIRPTSKKTPIA